MNRDIGYAVLVQAVFLVAGLAVAGCGKSRPDLDSCQTDADCAEKEQCFEGECRSTACTSDEHCAPGKTCQDRVCRDVTGCQSDADCNGERCLPGSGLCVQCLDESDCGGECPCIDNLCTCGCPAGYTDCDGECVDTARDLGNCGGCGIVCTVAHGAPGCELGCTILSCDSGYGDCDGSYENGCEVDLESDPLHCGECGVGCTAEGTCAGGECQCPDAPGIMKCGGACVDTDTNLSHCGECDNPCVLEMARCVGGTCMQGCSGGELIDCGGTCVDLRSDPENCGGCGSRCATTVQCVDGECGQAGVNCDDGGVCPPGELCCWEGGVGESCYDPDEASCGGYDENCDGPEDCDPGEVCCHDPGGTGFAECVSDCATDLAFCAEEADCYPAKPFCCPVMGLWALCRADPC